MLTRKPMRRTSRNTGPVSLRELQQTQAESLRRLRGEAS